ncbi:MAG TPA: hypothetical protein VJV79_33835 [Polyangiaceae bacterium]|nr:hypothetical protein [Polyangiaceae bacterium]
MKNLIVNTGRTRSASAGPSCSPWLWLVLFCVACGGRSRIESDRPLADWEQIIWDEPLETAVVYLRTASVTDTWAVVAAGPGGVDSFYRDHWDGLAWSRTRDELSHSDRFNDQQIWAAEDGQAVAGSTENLQRWSAGSWLDWQNTPGCRAVGGSALDDIWCATEDDLWRFDGALWTRQLMSGVRGILTKGRDDVWVWGTQGASHFDGARWSLELMNLVRSVSASEPTEVWALQDGDLLRSRGPGTAWIRQNPTGGSISSVWSQSKTNTWIVAAGAAMRWDGSSWQVVSLPDQDERLLISGSSDDVWIAGTTKLIHGRPTPR